MREEVNVTFIPLRISGFVPKGISLLDASRLLNAGIEAPCNGAGTCGKDLVQIRRAGRLDTVLACKTFLEVDTEVIIPSHDNNKDTKHVGLFYGNHSTAVNIINPSVKKIVSTKSDGTIISSIYFEEELIAERVGDDGVGQFGIALDIGTTSISAFLISLDNGNILGSSSMLNPLVYYGNDVMSRIRFSVSRNDGLLILHKELISVVNLLIDLMSKDSGINKENIYYIAAAGNTTMQHIFLNKEIKEIGEYPYIACLLEQFTTTAESLSIGISKAGRITTFPCISAYVGGDIVSGLIAVEKAIVYSPVLFIDIGTNSEMAIVRADGIIATSCAAGPCFEGMSISCGMRAGTGAIDAVTLRDGLNLQVIGGGIPKGICGSGLIDLIAEMIRTGIVSSNGRLQGKDCPYIEDVYRDRLFEKDGKRCFRLTDDLTISQEDIRQVQLARAAIRTGAEILLAETGINREEMAKVIIAGGFGYHIKKQSILSIGLIPLFPNAETIFVGNSSLEGARMALLNKDVFRDATTIARKGRFLELANVNGFEKVFVREMRFSE